MRISTAPTDPGFRADADEWAVLLDGEPQSATATGRVVVTADEALGCIWYRPADEDGDVLICEGFGSDWPLHEARGKVSVYRISSEMLPRR